MCIFIQNVMVEQIKFVKVTVLLIRPEKVLAYHIFVFIYDINTAERNPMVVEIQEKNILLSLLPSPRFSYLLAHQSSGFSLMKNICCIVTIK
jgi:hypothetical protein